jgi:hypothetical protein
MWWMNIVLMLGMIGSGWAMEGIPDRPPSFWDQSIVVGVGRPEWVYYHLTNLPKNSVLYCPNYPESPEAYPDWPRRRLTRPLSVEKDGQIVMRDPHVERAREEQAREQARLNESLASRVLRWIQEEGKIFFPQDPLHRCKNYLFMPKLDDRFTSSTLFRYLPPDQFWQVCQSDVILVKQSDPLEIRRKLVMQGRQNDKLVLMVDVTPYDETVHNHDYWQPWSLFCRESENRKELTDGKKIELPGPSQSFEGLQEQWGRGGVEPNQSGEQTSRRWRILRQVDWMSNAYVDVLVDSEGQIEAPWRVGERGSRFELWVMQWGTVRASLVESWSSHWESSMPDENGRVRQEGSQVLARLFCTGGEELVEGQSYHLHWGGAPRAGESVIQKWEEDREGQVQGGSLWMRVERTGDECIRSKSREGAENYAWWWRGQPSEKWILLSQIRQRIMRN